MFMKRVFNMKIAIEEFEKKLSEHNTWVSEYKHWNDVWASIQLNKVSITKSDFLFTVRWHGDFPKKFRVKIHDVIFMPSKMVAIDLRNNLVIFHATQK